MSSFFDNYLNFKKIAAEKREYRRQMARVDALPEDYRYVFKKIQSHTWMFASGSGYDMMRIHYGLIDLFEEGAANGKRAIEVTGEDVAAFCDALISEAQTYAGDWRQTLNRDIHKKFGSRK
ncbi:MAG: DUF1048 domain-containing protein [Clostridiales Family XIII bacterium]|jgi:DNA-binding ferritin-like protein (Dps family)|nr:DUF1048 domain-containing protein [Clostridiales Family XIII bacterium]